MTPWDHVDAGHEEAVAALCEFLRIKSISTQPQHDGDVRSAAAWIGSYMQRIGLEVQMIETARHPVVLGTSPPTDGPTVLIYGHYDVQPSGDLDRWTTPPFEPSIRNGLIFARGVADNKGQLFAQVLGVEAMLKANERLPLNIKIVAEGEEEIGSPNLPVVLRDRPDLFACDVVAISDTPVWRTGQPALSLGTRGVIGTEVKVFGPNCDLHSGIYGGTVPNPIAVLSRMLAALHDGDGRMTIPGFYDRVDQIPEVERRAWARLGHDDDAYARMLGCGLHGEAGFTTLERRWGRPTLEFNGVTGGYQGPGSNTIVPEWASAKITGRLVPRQDPEELQSALIEHLRSLAPAEVRVEFTPRKVGARAYAIDPQHPALQCAAEAFRSVYGVDPVSVREGLSLPILSEFRSTLGADTVLMGFCDPDCRAHSFDEFFATEDLRLGARTAAAFLERYAETSP